MARVPVTIAPTGATVWVDEGTVVIDALRAAGVVVPAPCGGRGVCGSCGVRVLDGALAQPDAQESLGLRWAPADVRLACRARVCSAVTVRPVVAYGSLDTPIAEAKRVPLVAGVDLGTTGVAAAVIDAVSGRELGRGTVPNRQQVYGADVLSRVAAALDGSGAELRSLAEESIAEALALACDQAAVSPLGLGRVVVAANSAMSGLLAGAEMTGLAAHPFSPPYEGGELGAGDVIIRLAPDARLTVLPPIGAFVGSDALAGAVAHGLSERERPTLLIDIGTNAEIVFVAADRVLAASAAAGPAFEGAGVSCGGPAAPGAVTAVSITGADVVTEVIGDVEPGWLTGSGLVSALAELSRTGHLRPDGLLVEDGPLAARFSRDEAGVLGVELAASDVGCVRLSQLDVRALQLAKAAIRTAVETVLREAGAETDALEQVLVAGAFGGALKVDDVVQLGVVPRRAADVVRAVGNAALDGAVMAALDEDAWRQRSVRLRSAEVVDLAATPDFQQSLLHALSLEPW